MHKWFVYNEFSEASNAAADFLAKHIETTIKKKDICNVVLPGGNSPAACLKILQKKKLPWNNVNWFIGDERCYPLGHVDRNDVMLDKNLWSQLSASNVYRIPAEFGPEQGAKVYREVLKSIDSFDIVFLGMGEDGHTASLFPDNEALKDSRSVVPVYDSPKEPRERVSLSINTLKQADCRMVLTGGPTKSPVISRIKEDALLPVNMIGDINWFIDEAANLPVNESK